MRGNRPALGVLIASAVLLAGCSASSGRTSQAIEPAPDLSDWVEIDGRWEVTYAEGGHALLQPAVEDGWLDDGSADEPAEAGDARWVSAATGETVWSRDDLAEVVYSGDTLIVAVGSGDDRSLEAVEVATGAALWSVPESDLGECAGWQAVGERDADGTSVLVMAAPAECGDGERTVLAQLDPATGATEQLLDGAGELDVRRVEDSVVLLTWTRDGATIRVVDVASAEVTTTIDLEAAELLEGTFRDGRLRFDNYTSLALEEAVAGGVWLTLTWNNPDDDEAYPVTINEFYVDVHDGTAERAVNVGCVYEGEASAWWHDWDASDVFCGVMGMGDDIATVTVGVGEDATSWRLPVHGDRPNWARASCVDPTGDERPLLLAPATDATLQARDLHSGEVVWSIASADPGPRVMVATFPESDGLVVLSEDGASRQLLQVVRLCTGEVVSERSVEGAFLDGRFLASEGGTVTVPLASTTLVASYPPEDGEDGEGGDS